jgi:hypothetical protein
VLKHRVAISMVVWKGRIGVRLDRSVDMARKSQGSSSVKRYPPPDPQAKTDFFGVLDFLEEMKPGGPWRLHALSRRGDPERSAVEILRTHEEVVAFLRAYDGPDCDMLFG